MKMFQDQFTPYSFPIPNSPPHLYLNTPAPTPHIHYINNTSPQPQPPKNKPTKSIRIPITQSAMRSDPPPINQPNPTPPAMRSEPPPSTNQTQPPTMRSEPPINQPNPYPASDAKRATPINPTKPQPQTVVKCPADKVSRGGA
ncbi:hypothetical protein EDD80_11050 [Anseongella ginsenosidimutans]|uniref:Uncharacterized protein n=1 Tax=Anseongella ginsenosidimutans TaxID=496056 RepID=A0A4R3KPQ0_9SPHI|nr:hypothetical protein EDD80_11050 [Anseongella ginsenosidimutans]